jgi:hypothetical protein
MRSTRDSPASVQSSDYQWFVEQGGLTRENGQKFREAILSRGNSADLAEPVIFLAKSDFMRSTRDSPASVQSSDRVRASFDKVRLNQRCCRETKSPHGISARFHASIHPVRQTYRNWRGHDPKIEPMLENRGLSA